VLDLAHEHVTFLQGCLGYLELELLDVLEVLDIPAFLHQKYDCYFFTINMEQYIWIRNPFSANVEIST